MKIKYTIVIAVIAVIALVFIGCSALSPNPKPTDNLSATYDVELLMPGNTLVTGECEQMKRISSGWISLKINGTWYSCNEWRVVLKERD